MNGPIGSLCSSGLVRGVGVALLVVTAVHLVGSGRGELVLWTLVAGSVAAAVVWGVSSTSNAARLTSATLAGYTVGVVWLVQGWPSPLVLWAGITLLLLTATVASFRSTSRPARAVCILMVVGLPQALWTALIEQAFAGWTMF